MALIQAHYDKYLAAKQPQIQVKKAVCIEIIQVSTSDKTQAMHWQVIQKPLSHFTPSISRFQASYCLLALGMTIGFNIFFIIKDLDLKILDGIIVPLLFLYILAVQMTISKCRQRESQVLEV